MENRFDEITKALAGGRLEPATRVSRRTALLNVGRGLAGALLASLGMGTAEAAPWRSRITCGTLCRRFSTRAERNRCLQVCRSCRSPSLLCGTTGFNLTCCTGTCCDGVCTNPATDPANCGACGAHCGSFPNVRVTCRDGNCSYVCAEGWTNCDGFEANGCEAHLPTDPANCGACGADCGSFPNVQVTCRNGHCSYVCAEGWANCDGFEANGCEVRLLNDPDNCGACGNVCGRGAPHCVHGACSSCPAGMRYCHGTCVDVGADPDNCGACGVHCAFPEVCNAGQCMPNDFVDPGYW